MKSNRLMELYSRDFAEAEAFSLQHGCLDDPYQWARVSEPFEKSWPRIENELLKAGITSFKYSAGQCAKWSYALRPLFERALGHPLIITFGQLYFKGRPVFSPTLTDCIRWWESGLREGDNSGTGWNFHVWYTQPDRSILDITFMSMLAMSLGHKELEGAMVYGHPDVDFINHRYIPLVLGDRFLEVVSKKSVIPLIATNISQHELNQVPIAFAFTEDQ